MALAALRTLWSDGPVRCVLLKQLQPALYAVQLYSGARVLLTELVDDPEEARAVAVQLWVEFSKSA